MTTILILYYFGDYFEIALLFIYQAGPIHERKGMHVIFSEKGEKGKKGQNIGKFEQKFTRFENILKKGSFMHATMTCMKQLEYVLPGYIYVELYYQVTCL